MFGELPPWSPIRSVLQEMNPFRQDADELFERFFGKDSFELDMPMLPAVESLSKTASCACVLTCRVWTPRISIYPSRGTRSPSGHRANGAATRAMGTSNARRSATAGSSGGCATRGGESGPAQGHVPQRRARAEHTGLAGTGWT
jgi:hypothetical protein